MARCTCGSLGMQLPKTLFQSSQLLTHRAPLRNYIPAGLKGRRQHVLRVGNQVDSFQTLSDRLLQDQMQMMNQMDRMMEQIDRDVDRAVQEADLAARRAQEMAKQQEQELLRNTPSIKVQRQAESTSGSFRYYESVQVQAGGTGYYYPPAPTAAPTMFSPALVAAAVLAGVYAVITTAFFKNFDLTVYKDQGRWVLAPLWPFLLIINASFRNQFLGAIRGIKPKLDDMSSQ